MEYSTNCKYALAGSICKCRQSAYRLNIKQPLYSAFRCSVVFIPCLATLLMQLATPAADALRKAENIAMTLASRRQKTHHLSTRQSNHMEAALEQTVWDPWRFHEEGSFRGMCSRPSTELHEHAYHLDPENKEQTHSSNNQAPTASLEAKAGRCWGSAPHPWAFCTFPKLNLQKVVHECDDARDVFEHSCVRLWRIREPKCTKNYKPRRNSCKLCVDRPLKPIHSFVWLTLGYVTLTLSHRRG